MASSGSKNDRQADDNVTKLTCPICLEKYRRPKLLPCFHTFCQSCLQGVAGCSPSFPCPSCRTIVLLPPGGVGALQTNFYIEDDSATSPSSPPRRLCDVCTDDREATHSCLQCQQRYCLPCRKHHDSFRSCYGHTLVALTEEDEGCGKGIAPTDAPKVADVCPKHPDQRLMFHCTRCKMNLCLQCKLTQHEGHPTQDLADASAKVKDKLKDRLRTLTQDIQEIAHTVGAFEDRCSKFQEHKRTTEAEFRARADTLHQWVKQSLDMAVSSLQASGEQVTKPWQDRAEQLGNRKRALQAQQDHILRVLKDGQEADLMSLEAQLTASPQEDVDMTQMKTELTKDMPSFRVEHNTTAIDPVQIHTFLGMLAQPLLQQSSGNAPDPIHRGDSRLSTSSLVNIGARQPGPREFTYSKNPESFVQAMCPISQNRLWILYRPAANSVWCLKLFDAQGQVLSTVNNPVNNGGLITAADDIALYWLKGERSVELISPDGSLSTCTIGSTIKQILSCATNDAHYLRYYDETCLDCVQFVNQTQSGKAASGSTHRRRTHSVKEVVFDVIPSDGSPIHASAAGRYFAFISGLKVEVYTRTGSTQRKSAFVCSYKPKKGAVTARFCQINGQEMLLVVGIEENNLHVVDHSDGGCFVHFLDTGPLNLVKPRRLATDYDKHVWIGCEGGKVVVVDL